MGSVKGVSRTAQPKKKNSKKPLDKPNGICYNDYVPKRGTESEESKLNISKPELQAVIRTLPIGLYIKRGVAVSVGDGETSFYSPHTDTIEVSFPQIQLALSKIPDNDPHKEQIIRSILYHETSHAFITPQSLTDHWNDVINVFEDERMETLLANYYHDVDFKSNVYRFNGLEVGEIPPATNKFQEFYNLVRFRSGSPKMLARVAEIIKTYKELTRNTEWYGGWGSVSCYNYYKAVMNLYDDCKNPESPNPEFEGDVQQSADGEPCEGEIDGDMTAPMVGKGEPNESLTPEQVKELIGNIVNDKKTNELVAVFQAILDGFSKKNKGGSSIGGYSGVLNPRNANREDYKIFDRPFTERANNQFGTCHLNLFIDRSGSFWHSQDLVNKLLVALSAIEKRNPNFTLDVVFCGIGQRVAQSPKDRVLNCDGGNCLTDSIFEIYRKLQKPNTYNYNIVLFDGDAFSSGTKAYHKNFRAFDFNNCTIISDRDNERYIAKTVKKAKVIYTREYTKELLTNIQNTLARAFR